MSHRPPDLLQESRVARALLEELRASGVDDEETVDLAVASETNLVEAAEAVLDAVHAARALADGCGQRIEALWARKGRLERRVDVLRGALARAIDDAGLPGSRLVTPGATLTVSRARDRCRVTDPEAVPADLRRSKTTVEPDKSAILARLMAGDEVPGACLDNGGRFLRVTAS